MLFSPLNCDYRINIYLNCSFPTLDALGTIDYLDAEDKVAFRTCDIERDKVIVQIGTADPERALKAAKLV